MTEQLDPQILFSNGPYPYRSGNFTAAGVDILASQGSLLVLHIDHIGINGVLNPVAGAGDQAFAGTESFDGIAISPIMTHLLSIPFGGRITHVALTTGLSGPVPPGLPGLAAQLKALPMGDAADQQKLLVPVIHKWAEAGGHGSVSLAATIGPSTLNSEAALKFDANLQPQGTADLTANHLDQFFAAVTDAYPQLQNQVAQVMAQLSAYIGSTPQDGQTLTIHAVYGSGAVSINGQKVAPLPPVDWTSLENPPATPPPAPGDGSGAAAQ